MAQTVYPNYPQSVDPSEPDSVNPWLIRIPLLTAGGIALFIALILLFVAVHLIEYDGLIYPGVSAYGVSLGGLTTDQAAAALSKTFTYGTQAIFTFRDGDKSWQMSAADLGVQFDPKQAAEQAYEVGRSGGLVRGLIDQWRAWMGGNAIAPTIYYNQSQASAFLQQVGAQINRPTLDATINIKGTTVSTTAGQTGRSLDVNATLGLLRQVILNMNTGAEIPLVIRELPPAVADASAVAAQVRAALATPIQLSIPNAKQGEGPWQLSPDFIAKLITIKRVDDGKGAAHYEADANMAPVKQMIQGLAAQLKVDPVDARFVFNESSKQLQVTKDSVSGRSLDVDGSVNAVQNALFRPDNRQITM